METGKRGVSALLETQGTLFQGRRADSGGLRSHLLPLKLVLGLLGGSWHYGFRNLVLSITLTLTKPMRLHIKPKHQCIHLHAFINALGLQRRYIFKNQEIRVPTETSATKSKHNADYKLKGLSGHGEPTFSQ